MLDYIVTGICCLNRNIRHYIIPYIKNECFPEWQEMAPQIFKVMKMSHGIHY